MNFALCAGHTLVSPGAVTYDGAHTEHELMMHLVPNVGSLLEQAGHEVKLIVGRLSEKVAQVNDGAFDFALDFHFNSFKGEASGCEVLYYPDNKAAQKQAAAFSRGMSRAMRTRDRGAKEGYYWGGEAPGTRVDYFLAKTKCRAFIPEALFIHNKKDVDYWINNGNLELLAVAHVEGIKEMLNVG